MDTVSQYVARHGFQAAMVRIACVVFVFALGSGHVAGQAVAEYGHLTSGARAASSKPLTVPAFKTTPPIPATTAKSPHLMAASAESPELVNRKAFEQSAGADGAKLNFGSVPSNASVHINGKMVGRTPLSLVVPPGTYSLEMEGSQKQFAKTQISVRPKETQEVTLSLRSRYPAHVQLR